MSEYYTPFPLCQKYDAPIIEGRLKDKDAQAWVKSLPDDWPDKFWKVMGPVTRDDIGTYACDVEDSLWALERNQPYRKWNG